MDKYEARAIFAICYNNERNSYMQMILKNLFGFYSNGGNRVDNCSNSQKIGRMLRKRYIIALSIIAFLVVFSQVIIQYSITKQQDDSRVVNISGRQRMLSQRINKDAFGLYVSVDEKEQKLYLDELTQSLDL